MSRQHSWRDQYPGAVIVDRRTAFGNPYKVVHSPAYYSGPDAGWQVLNPSENWVDGARATVKTIATADACRLFEHDIRSATGVERETWDRRLAALEGRTVACWCPRWDTTSPCPRCDGVGVIAELRETASTNPVLGVVFWHRICPVCEGTGFACYPCHGDVLLRLANPDVVFPWVVAL